MFQIKSFTKSGQDKYSYNELSVYCSALENRDIVKML